MIPQDKIAINHTPDGGIVGELEERMLELSYLKPGAIVVKFEGVDKLLDYVSDKMPTAKRAKSSEGHGGSFNAFSSYSEAMDTFRSKAESIVKFDQSELRIKDDMESGTQVDYDVTGDYIDMGRFMEGIPESVGTMHNGNARNRRANIIINISYTWRYDYEDILRRGERILRLVDALEAGGVRTKLTAIESSGCGHTEMTIKQHHEPLTITDLAVVSHPEFLRRIIFRISEYSRTWQDGYGSAIDFSHAMNNPKLLETESVNELNIFVDSNMTRNVVDRLFDQLERLLVWEMSKPVPEVTSIRLGDRGIDFSPNGYRSSADIIREGKEVINEN